jgi:Fe-S cluster assembly iron-binding protein IscA/acetyl esterase/lipase
MLRFLRVVVLASLLLGCGLGFESTGASQPVPPKEPEKKDEPKTVVVLTAKAAEQLAKLQKESGAKYLRVSVVKEEFKLDLDTEKDKEDHLEESRGISILIDKKSFASVPRGTVVDYIDTGKTGFKISPPEEVPDLTRTLVEARKGFKTKLTRESKPGEPLPKSPPEVFLQVKYEAPAGKLGAYLTPDPKDGKKHPAIIWITGGDCNSVDDVWSPRPAKNDQSASAYRQAGIVMMFPSLRGGNDNPGIKEGFLGEVDDVLGAVAFLRKQPYVDPDRIYLGGHSTGGTLVLLVAECSDAFRAVFSFGPVVDVGGYGPQFNPFALTDREERRVRSPGLWLHSIRNPVFVFEGARNGNADSLRKMAATSKNPKVQFFEIPNTDHFALLDPTNRLIAQKILKDTAAASNLAFTPDEVNKPFQK